ncbi:MAG TPA: ribonuclease HI family protein [Ktedonobacteraceae bacterium]|nr:ribonuclease HI family protein [Ktedonobacteraceae bacterium]
MSKSTRLTIDTDGGARGNPGPAAAGVYIVDEMNKPVYEIGHFLGFATNNEAEYQALLLAYEWLLAQKHELDGVKQIEFRMDSEVIHRQLTGRYAVRHPVLKQLWRQVKQHEEALGRPVAYTRIPRAQNKQADRLVNQALDREEE